MKPRTETVEKQEQVTGRKIEMTFEKEALPHLQNIFINMYADPVAATIREILSNARDAHRRVDTDAPIEVTLPSEWQGEFVVRDHGVGMSPEVFEKNYARYGASTKRETDDEVGMLGLGAKAPLSYTDQFTVVTVGGGIKTVAIVARGETGTGEINVVSETETDEPTGTTVKIPVRDSNDFNHKVRQFVRYWKPEWVTINGEHPEEIEGFRVDPDILLTSDLHEDVVVMGGVPYSVDYNHRVGSWNTHAVITVPVGAVDFAPSREEVRYTDRTTETLDAARGFIREAVTRAAQDRIASAASHADALDAYMEVLSDTDRRLIDGELYYGGAPLKTTFEGRIQSYDTRADERTLEDRLTYGHLAEGNAILVDDYTNKTLSRTNKDKTTKLLRERGIDARYVNYVDGKGRFGAPWTDNVTRVSWEDIKAVELPKRQTSSGGSHVAAGTYKVVKQETNSFGRPTWSTSEIPADELSGALVYMSPASDFNSYGTLARHFGKDITVVILGKNRWDKFNREFEDTHHVLDALKFEAETVVAEMAPTDSTWGNLDWGDRWINKFDIGHAARLLDNDLSEAIISKTQSAGRLDRYREVRNLYQSVGGSLYGAEFPAPPTAEQDASATLKPIKQRYPLLDEARNPDALIDYVNAMVTVAEMETEEAEVA